MTEISKAVDEILDILDDFDGEDVRTILNLLDFNLDKLEEE